MSLIGRIIRALSGEQYVLDDSLLMAAHSGRWDKIADLLSKGANINTKDKARQTPLHYAAKYNLPHVIDRLLEHGADVTAKDKDGESVLEAAIQADSLYCVKRLVEHGVSVVDPSRTGWTALHHAAVYAGIDIADYLLQKGAKIDAKDDIGETPYDCVKNYGGKSGMKAFLHAYAEKHHLDALVEGDDDAPSMQF